MKEKEKKNVIVGVLEPTTRGIRGGGIAHWSIENLSISQKCSI